MQPHTVVSQNEWLAARKAHLVEEKAFSRARDALSAKRRALPWLKVEKAYVFDGPNGKETLADLFGGKNQLIVYHFMLGPDWEEGCPSCSLIADHFDGAITHLAQRDVTFAVVSRAPLPIRSKSLSGAWAGASIGCRRSATISTTTITYPRRPRRRPPASADYNYELTTFPSDERPGTSAFYKNAVRRESSTPIRATAAASIS
jgi:predicted dithiol-disulfide oxidoreductase (DUF899 family)